MSSAPRFQFSLGGLLTTLLFLSVLAAVAVPVHARLRRMSLKSGCKNNLQMLGNYLRLYMSRYCPPPYPNTYPPGGSGAPVPAGLNGVFWSHLYRVPNQANACSVRPGDDSLYVCKVTGTRPTSSALEYTAPNFAAIWPNGHGADSGGPVYPGGRLSEATRGEAPLGGDLIGPSDSPNHGGEPGVPNEIWNLLCFDGHVEIVAPNSAQHILYATATVGVRTT
ncbi:MAG: hypothetical protein HZA54_19095 [Planctomycetes bacterium]|nr:hypothetical protein [Planctomycetota bacterium]